MIRFNNSISILFLAVVLLFVSCGTDDDSTPEEPGSPNNPAAPISMTALVDGEDWASSANFEPGISIHNDYLIIFGFSSSNYEMSMTLCGTTDGNYSLDPETGNQLYYRQAGNSTFDSKLNNDNTNFGFVNMTMDSENQTMSGTFETEAHSFFNGNSNSRIITEGQFTNVPVTDERDPDAESLSTNIDGRPLKAVFTSGFLSQGLLNITGEDAVSTERIALMMPPDVAVGTYNLGDQSTPMFDAKYNPLFSNVDFNANTGILTITSHDTANKIIEGTFSFETPNVDGDGEFNVNDGEFRASYD